MRLKMRLFFTMMLVLAPAALPAQYAARDADRAQTERLNRNVAVAASRRDAANAATLDRYREAQTAYERQRETWRRRLAACAAGDDRACEPR